MKYLELGTEVYLTIEQRQTFGGIIVGVNKEDEKTTIYKRYLIGLPNPPIGGLFPRFVGIETLPVSAIEKGAMEVVNGWNEDYDVYYYASEDEVKPVSEVGVGWFADEIRVSEKVGLPPLGEELKPLSWIYKNYIISRTLTSEKYSIKTMQGVPLINHISSISSIDLLIHEQQHEEMKKIADNIEVMQVVKRLLENNK